MQIIDANQIRKNSLFSFLSISSRLIANVVIFWILARYYGPEIFGQFTFAQTLAAIFILFADFGLDILLTNELAKNKDNAKEIFQILLPFKLIFSVLSLILMWVVILINQISFQSKVLIVVFSFYMLLSTLSNFYYALFKGFEKLEYETKISFFTNLLLLLFTLPFIYFKTNIIIIAMIFVFTRFLSLVLSIKYSKRFIQNISLNFFTRKTWYFRGKIMIYGLHLTFSYLFFQLDTILIAILKGDQEVGNYQAVIKIVLLPLVIPEILSNAIFPTLARMNSKNVHYWEKLGELMNRILFIIGFPFALSFFLFPEKIILLLYGSNYLEAIPVLRIFGVIIFVRFNLETAALMLTTSEKQKTRLLTVFLATIINLILNIIFIPEFGITGAAIISLLTNTFVGIVYLYIIREVFLKWMFNKTTLITIIFSGVVGFMFSIVNTLSIFLLVPFLFLFFLIFTYFYSFSIEEKKMLFSSNIKFNR